jgi:hypothetical protein
VGCQLEESIEWANWLNGIFQAMPAIQLACRYLIGVPDRIKIEICFYHEGCHMNIMSVHCVAASQLKLLLPCGLPFGDA